MNLATVKALQQTAAAAVADLGSAVDALLADTGTEIRKLVNDLVHDVDRVTYQRDVAEKACRELRGERDALKARIAELMDLVDEGDRERDGLIEQLAKAEGWAADVDERDMSKAPFAAALMVAIAGAGDEGDTETTPHDDILSTPLAAELKAVFKAGGFVVDVSHAGLHTPVVERCGSCSALADRGHLSDCPVGAIVGGAP